MESGCPFPSGADSPKTTFALMFHPMMAPLWYWPSCRGDQFRKGRLYFSNRAFVGQRIHRPVTLAKNDHPTPDGSFSFQKGALSSGRAVFRFKKMPFQVEELFFAPKMSSSKCDEAVFVPEKQPFRVEGMQNGSEKVPFRVE